MMKNTAAADPVYSPIAAFAGQLAALGVHDVVISPGSRSTPLSLAFHAHPALRTHIQLDERSAGFFALPDCIQTYRTIQRAGDSDNGSHIIDIQGCRVPLIMLDRCDRTALAVYHLCNNSVAITH